MNTKKPMTAITPTRADNYPEWYQQVVRKAELAEPSTVRGCMVMKPWGYALWENMQKVLDKKFKDTGHQNIYCPLLIPVSFLEKEAKHIKGFAEECAVVTHHRLVLDEETNKLVPSSPLEEPLIIRPTSEAIIGEMCSRWIQSYRDLPLLLNQWANVVRWEMRPRMFLRTTEFLWQEGHTAHATQAEAEAETTQMLDVYADFAQNYLAMPVIKGRKTSSERFPGAEDTYCIEAMMQDGKALQAGTSHFLGRNFSRAFDISFQNEKGERELVWTTSWGVSTRLIGGLIMVHSDDDGLILPPMIAPSQIVILPVVRQPEQKETVLKYCQALAKQLEQQTFNEQPVRVTIEQREGRTGDLMWQWVKKGIPVRLEIGMREIENNNVSVGRRDLPASERAPMNSAECVKNIGQLLAEIQNNLLARAKNYLQQKTVTLTSEKEFYDYFKESNTQTGFVMAHYFDNAEVEAKLKSDLNVTARCIPLENQKNGKCIFSGKDNAPLTVFAKAY